MKRKSVLKAWMISSDRIVGAPGEYAAVWRAAIKRFELKGRAGESALVLDGPAPSLLLGIADPKSKKADARSVFESAIRAMETAKRQKFDVIEVGGIPAGMESAAWRGLAAADYSFKVGRKKKVSRIERRVLGLKASEEKSASVVAESTALARDLVNTPPADKAPAVIASTVARELRRAGVKSEVWDEGRLRRERCRGLLAVSAGSLNPPRLVRMTYAPRGAAKHIVLVGKGITFDSGGLNIKTYEGMKAMKCDMAGAAAVVAAILAAARLRLKVRITGIVGFAENMPGRNAFKPGDVITMRSGKTVEILNTDAEGRIILGDMLHLGAAAKPDAMVNMATLTGACLVALGDETAGLFANNDRLASDLLAAASTVGESLWRLPLNRDFTASLKGSVSDLKNVGTRYGGACVAAAFLQEFVDDATWAHCDIGPAFRESGSSGRPSGATGYGVATLVEWLKTCVK